MREIKYIKQPTEYLCGQACVAMIANVSADDVIQVMHNDKGTGKKDIAKARERSSPSLVKYAGLKERMRK